MKAAHALLLAWFVFAITILVFVLVGVAVAQGIEVVCQDGYCVIKESDIRAIVDRLIYLEKNKGDCV